jgi:hypothetical protein
MVVFIWLTISTLLSDVKSVFRVLLIWTFEKNSGSQLRRENLEAEIIGG